MMKKNEEKKGKKETGKKVMSVKAKLLMILIPCIALAMALLILVFYMLVAKQMKRTSEDMLESSVRSQENQIESWMNEKLAAFQMIKTDIEKEPRTDEELQKLLTGSEVSFPAKSKRGKSYMAVGKIAKQTFKGNTFYGFKLNPKTKKA